MYTSIKGLLWLSVVTSVSDVNLFRCRYLVYLLVESASEVVARHGRSTTRVVSCRCYKRHQRCLPMVIKSPTNSDCDG